MFARITFLVIMINLLISPAYGERIEIGKSEQDALVVVEESNDRHTVIRFEISAFSKKSVDVNSNIYYSLSLEGELRYSTLENSRVEFCQEPANGGEQLCH